MRTIYYTTLVLLMGLMLMSCSTVASQTKRHRTTDTVLWQIPSSRPDWVDSLAEYKDKNPALLYFVGISIPNEYEALAFESARDNAAVEIASYLYNKVDARKYFADKTRNPEGYVPIQAIARDAVVRITADTIVQKQYETDHFTQYCSTKGIDGTVVRYFQIYRLFEFPIADALVAIDKTREDVQRKLQEENESVLKLIERSEKQLDEMKKTVLPPPEEKIIPPVEKKIVPTVPPEGALPEPNDIR